MLTVNYQLGATEQRPCLFNTTTTLIDGRVGYVPAFSIIMQESIWENRSQNWFLGQGC